MAQADEMKLVWRTTAGEVFSKSGAQNAPPVSLANNMRDIAVDGGDINAVSTEGNLFVRPYGAQYWDHDGTISAASKIALGGKRGVVITNNGNLKTREAPGVPTWGGAPNWIQQLGGWPESTSVSANRVAFSFGNGDLWVKQGGLDSTWVLIKQGTVFDVKLAGNRIVMRQGNGDVYVKEGRLTAPWQKIADDAKAIDADGNRIAYVKTNGNLYVKEGAVTAPWTPLVASATAVSLSGPTIAVILTDKSLYSRTGGLEPNWNYQAGNVAQVDVGTAGTAAENPIDTPSEADSFIAALRNTSDASATVKDAINVLNPVERNYVTARMDATWPSSREFGGPNWKVDTTGEDEAFREALGTRPSLMSGLAPADQNYVNATTTSIPTASGSRMKLAVRLRAADPGQLWTKTGTPDSTWILAGTDIKQAAVDGAEVAAVGDDTVLYERSYGANWGPNSGPDAVRQVARGGGRVAVITTSGELKTREAPGVPTWDGAPTWISQMQAALDTAVTANRVAVVDGNGTVWAKEGGLGAQWISLVQAAVDVEMAGDRVVVRLNNDELWLKDGPLTSVWRKIGDNIKAFDVAPNRIAMINSSQNLLVNEGAWNAPYTQLVGGAIKVSVSRNNVATILNDDHLWTKTGGLGATWVHQLGNADQVDVSEYDPMSWQYGGINHKVDTDGEADAVVGQIRGGNDAAGAAVYAGLSEADQTFTASRLNATWASSRAYGGGNWKLDSDPETKAVQEQLITMSTPQQTALIGGLVPDDRTYLKSTMALTFGDPTVTLGAVEVPTTADTAELGDADDAVPSSAGYSTRGCRVATFKRPLKSSAVTYGHATHRIRFCWNKLKQKTGMDKNINEIDVSPASITGTGLSTTKGAPLAYYWPDAGVRRHVFYERQLTWTVDYPIIGNVGSGDIRRIARGVWDGNASDLSS